MPIRKSSQTKGESPTKFVRFLKSHLDPRTQDLRPTVMTLFVITRHNFSPWRKLYIGRSF